MNFEKSFSNQSNGEEVFPLSLEQEILLKREGRISAIKGELNAAFIDYQSRVKNDSFPRTLEFDVKRYINKLCDDPESINTSLMAGIIEFINEMESTSRIEPSSETGKLYGAITRSLRKAVQIYKEKGGKIETTRKVNYEES